MDKIFLIQKVKELLEIYNLDEDFKIVLSEYLDNVDAKCAKEKYDVLISNVELYANGKVKCSDEVQKLCTDILKSIN